MIYVWHNVLCDYTCGLIVIRADTLQEAREFVRKHPDLDKWQCKIILDEIEDTEPDFTYLDSQNFLAFETGGG